MTRYIQHVLNNMALLHLQVRLPLRLPVASEKSWRLSAVVGVCRSRVREVCVRNNACRPVISFFLLGAVVAWLQV